MREAIKPLLQQKETEMTSAILDQYQVTCEMIAKVTLENGGATVTSRSGGPDHQVRYNTRFHRLTCTCKAGQDGTPCWAMRAALAAVAIERLAARAEAATVEADPDVQSEQAEVSAEQEAERASRYHDGPFCEDSNCPCHDDNDNYDQYVIKPLSEGLLSVDEANRIFYGRQ